MSGIKIEALRETAMGIVNQLKEVRAKHERTYPAEIQAVLVLSGPGTYLKPLKDYQVGSKDWARWMDHDRILAGGAIVREVTRLRRTIEVREQLGEYEQEIGRVPIVRINIDIVKRIGPYLVYNGTPEENADFRKAMQSPYWKVPQEKIVLIDEVAESDGSTHPIRHTGDQIASLFQAIRNPGGPLFGITHIAVVTQIQDYARVPFYLEKYNQEHIRHGGQPVQFYLYGVANRPGAEDQYIGVELSKLVEYAEKGDLATTPAGIIPRQKRS